MKNLKNKAYRTWAGAFGGGGGAGSDIKVKVSANDTTTDYLSAKLVCTDGSATLTIINPGANEQYDLSVPAGGASVNYLYSISATF